MKALANCEQGLNEEQKLQARTNIGAIGGVRVHDTSGTTDLVPDAQGRVTVDLTNAGKVQSDWDETNDAEPSYIRNKPDLSIYALKDEIESGVFIGVYTGTAETSTPYADYKSAWDDGKAVFLSYVSDSITLLLPMEEISDDEIVFTRTIGSVSGNDYGSVVNYFVSVSAEDDSYTFRSSSTGDEQVQSNWTETDTSDPSYIQNKPDLATVATTGSYDDLTDKPSIPAAQVQSDWNQADNTQVDYIKNKPTLSAVAESGDYDDLTNKPTIPAAQVQSDWAQSNSQAVDFIKNKPNLATVATSGSYNDLSDKPDIPSQQVQSDWTEQDTTDPAYIKNKPTLSSVATSGSYNDLSDKPSIPAAQVQSDWSQSNTSAVDYIKNKPAIPAAQVQSDWAQTNTSAVDYIKNKPAAMETKPLVAGTNIEFVSAPDRVTINSTGTKIVKRSSPYTTDSPVVSMTIFDPGESFGSVVQDQNSNTLGFLAPKHYGQNDEGKVLTVVSDNGYKIEWREPSGGKSDLKLLTESVQNVDSGTGAYQLTVADGYAYTLNMLVDREVQLVTNSTDTIHTRISVHNNDNNTCGAITLTWRDEALVQHSIYVMLYNVPNNVIYNFDVYIKKVTLNGTPYSIARVYDYPCAYRQGQTYSQQCDDNFLIGME